MESSQPEHFISLPLVSKGEESPRLPLAINVVAKYWGEDLAAAEEGSQQGQQQQAPRGAVMIIDGIELAESHGLACYVFRGSLKDIKKRIDQGIPPIVVMPGIHDIAQHATVISGYDLDERRILTYVPEPDTIGAIPEQKFEQDWEQDDMTEIILIPADMKKDLMKNEDLKFAKSNRACFEAERLRQEGKTEKAVEKLRQAAEAEPENAQAWSQLAGIYNEQGSEQAVVCYERAIKTNPRYYLAYRGLGNYYLKKKDYSLAEAYYTKAIGINPTRYGPIYKNRAVARMQNGNNAGAKEDLARYLEQTPNAADRESVKEAIAQL
ncbi:TPR repeat [Candidatus Nitrososphaera evergladensis SR1]|uniref:TPR repeat n=1 Tax=Candidatus Nitrososphaera evergladensis SR1 TaxID=1459636 RepID=A0A075MR43_9ARCH|nr:tetratricopeptide repeat protein [Candidatus Nitrososphaera evergladensis]AIF84026.1 TPR repeat [Candidatus Nitrososphaera evergladensis SR1]